MSHSASLSVGANGCNGCAIATTNIVAPFASSQNPVIRTFLNGWVLDNASGALQISISPTNL
jgi:hypothetical protein